MTVQKYERIGVKFLHSNEGKEDFRHVRMYRAIGQGYFDVMLLTGYGDVIHAKYNLKASEAIKLFRKYTKEIA